MLSVAGKEEPGEAGVSTSTQVACMVVFPFALSPNAMFSKEISDFLVRVKEVSMASWQLSVVEIA